MKKQSSPRFVGKSLDRKDLARVVGAQVDRAGFLNSDPSDANRLLERHELPGNQGGF